MRDYDLSEIVIPEVYISDANVAKAYIDGINESHESFWHIIELMEQHIEGKKPKDPRKLRDQGKSWVNNWNYGKARAKIEKTVAENIDTVLNSLFLMSVSFKELSEEDKKDAVLGVLDNDEYADFVANVIESTFNDTLDREMRLIAFLNILEYNATTWGWSVATKDYKTDWMGEAHHIRAIGFEDKSKPDNILGYATFDEIDGKELWRTWSEFKNSKNLTSHTDTDGNSYKKSPSGWIIEGLEEALYHAYDGKFNHEGKPENVLANFESIIPDYIANPSYMMQNTDSIEIAKIYKFEFDKKKFTVTYVAYNNSWKNHKQHGSMYRYKEGHPEFTKMDAHDPTYLLFQRTEEIDCQDDALTIIQDSGFTPNGYIQEMRGIAKYAVEDSIRFNRKKNSIEDKLILSGSPHIRKDSSGRGDTGPQFQPSQGYTVVGDGYSFLPDQPRFDLNNHMLSINMDEGHYNREIQHFDPQVSGRLSSRPVTKEVEVLSQEVSVTKGSKIEIKLRCYSKLVLGMLKGMSFHMGKTNASALTNDAESGFNFFKDQCLRHLAQVGIDNEDKLKKVMEMIDDVSIEASMSNPEAIIEQLNQTENPYVRARLNRMLAINRGFSRKEIKLMHPMIYKPKSLTEERIAAFENNILKDTAEVVFSASDNHPSHLNMHFSKVFGVFEEMAVSNVDPVPLFNWANRITEHIGFHVDALLKTQYISEQIKTKYLNGYKQLLVAIKDAQAQVNELVNKIKQQQEAQAQAQQSGGEVDPKVMADIQNERIKLQNREQIAAIRSEFRAKEKQKDAEFRRKLQEESHQDQMRRKRELAELQEEINILKASTKLANN